MGGVTIKAFVEMLVEQTLAQEAVRQLELVDGMPHFGDNNYVKVVA